MVYAHNLGFPRIGFNREMKKNVESYWRGEISLANLSEQGLWLQSSHWQLQVDAGLNIIPVGDFSWYDHVLDTSILFNVIPERFQKEPVDLMDIMFCMARGKSSKSVQFEAPPCEMTKWFDTNYHYIVPEFSKSQKFKLNSEKLLNEVKQAKAQGSTVKPVILGPLSFLWLGKGAKNDFNKLHLIDPLISAYEELFQKLNALNVEWIQIDEPILALDLDKKWQSAFAEVYNHIHFSNVKCLLATYFGSIAHHLPLITSSHIQGLHVDLCRAPQQLASVIQHWPTDRILSLGIVNGRNIWRNDLHSSLIILENVHELFRDRLWVAPSCSLLHVPVDLNQETELNPELKSWLAFAKQKIKEVALLTKALNEGRESIASELEESRNAINNHQASDKLYNPTVRKRLETIDDSSFCRHSIHAERKQKQQAHLNLPKLPTTTIGSFPQTRELREFRRDFKEGKIDLTTYEKHLRSSIHEVIEVQESLHLDVLVHGEPERNDMVEYFGGLLEGVTITRNGWVQSYGSRCVKPPIIFGDVSRPEPMTVEWIEYAQSLTSKPVKGMLTGPVTIAAWSFLRDDQPSSSTALQIALALRDETADLESAGISVIQIDEPAFRETLPLRRENWEAYFKWAINSFKLASSGVKDETQIHTHMCYSEFNQIIEAIAQLDADVITIESSRSNMELLRAFTEFSYPNDLGPGVYDIHSPRIPSVEEIENLIRQALKHISMDQLWINPDCGLKTRDWTEVKLALSNLTTAALNLREMCSDDKTQSPSEDLDTSPIVA